MLRYEASVQIRVLRRQGKSLRQIADELGVAVNTVRKYLVDEDRPHYGRRAPVRRKLGRFEPYLQARVAAAAPEWIPARVLWREILEQGFSGTERTVQRYVKTLKPVARADPVVRFETEPGEQLQLDWIEFRKRRGELLAAFVATLGWSRASFVRFVDNERAETLIDCVQAALAFFDGVPRTILADNVKTIVDRRNAYGEGLHRWHPAFWDLAQSYGFAIRLCAPYRARTKGKVERMNGYLRRSFYVPLAAKLRAAGLELDVTTANLEVARWLREIANARIHGTTGEVPAIRLIAERQYLLPLPHDYRARPFPRQVERDRACLQALRALTSPAQHPLAIYEALLCEAST